MAGNLCKAARILKLLLFCVLLSALLAEPVLAQSKTKFRPFAGRWLMQTQYGYSGSIDISPKERFAILNLAGVLRNVVQGLPTVHTRITFSNRKKTTIRLRTYGDSWIGVDGKLQLDPETYQIIHGELKFYDQPKNGQLLTTAIVAAYAVPDPNFTRTARLFVDLERVGARGAQAGRAFFLRGIVEAKGPAPIPDQTVFLFMYAPDTLSLMEVTSNNRMSRCGELRNTVQGHRTAWCLLRPLGPGGTDRGSFTVKMVPDIDHFSQGGKFRVTMALGTQSGGVIDFVSRPKRALATINVKGRSRPPVGDEPTDEQKRCWGACFAAGSPPGFWGDNCERCKILCGFKKTSCKPS